MFIGGWHQIGSYGGFNAYFSVVLSTLCGLEIGTVVLKFRMSGVDIRKTFHINVSFFSTPGVLLFGKISTDIESNAEILKIKNSL